VSESVRVKEILNEHKKTGRIMRTQIKGLTDEELRLIVNTAVKGGISAKATVYSSMKDHI
jgi:hypothetical protein